MCIILLLQHNWTAAAAMQYGVYRMNKIKHQAHFLCWRIAFAAWISSHCRYTELCSSILRKRSTQSTTDSSNLTNHSTRVSLSLCISICLFSFFFLFVFFPLFIHRSYFSCLAPCGSTPLCQRNKLSVCQISVQRLRLNQYSNYAYINIMHALFAFIQLIHSIHQHNIFTLQTKVLTHAHTHKVLYELPLF